MQSQSLRNLITAWVAATALLSFTTGCSGASAAQSAADAEPSAVAVPAAEAPAAAEPEPAAGGAEPGQAPEVELGDPADAADLGEGVDLGDLGLAEMDGDARVGEDAAAETEVADDPGLETPDTPGPIDSAALLQESLEAFESAEVFWQQGSFEDAFAALDRAYELMVAVPPNGDPLIAQQKDDLRNLISRRVVELYASRQTAVGDLNRAIPVTVNADVRREIESFQGPEREFFLRAYQRSGLYRPIILEELHRAGLPEQISWLPLVESGFGVRALSRARALGLWQFIASTGYRYGLERSWWVDERMDPVESTRAAIAYLTDLHNLFGDWLTAMAAYNCGEQTVLRQINNQRVGYFDQFWDLYQRLPRETRRYVPRFLAVLAILEDPSGYGFELPEPLAPLAYESVEIERSADLKALDRALGLEDGSLEALNPQLRRWATPDAPYALRVPPGVGETLLANLENLPEWVPPSRVYTVHRVRRGETLSGVASRYRSSIRELMELNRLASPNRIWPGQQLRVPDRRPAPAPSSRVAAADGEVRHQVRQGDSLWSLAHRYGTTVDRIRRANGLNGNLLRPGQELIIHGGGGVAGATYVVQQGDTLGSIARHRGVALERLLEANQLSRRSTIYPGQELVIPE